MRIKRFIGKKIYGFLDLDVSFNDDLSFLHGKNGTGKTTVLKLIYYLTNPSLLDLYIIRFLEVKLILEIEDRLYEIAAKKIEEYKMVLQVVEITHGRVNRRELIIDPPSYKSNRAIYRDTEEMEEYINSVMNREERNDTLLFLNNIQSILFLGLDRMQKLSKSVNRRRRLKNSLIDTDESMRESLENIYMQYKTSKKEEEKILEEFRKEIIFHSFETLTDSTSEVEVSLDQLKEALKDRDNIRDTFGMLSDPRLTESLDHFFDAVQSYVDISINSEDDLNFYRVIYFTEMNKLVDLHRIVTSYQKDIEQPLRKFSHFEMLMNQFFADSGKELKIDFGEVRLFNNGSVSSSTKSLSSGERQLFLIFSKVFFASSSEVLIIDEPELSLHPTWQKMFVKKLRNTCNNMQLIMATHSPEIVARNIEKIIGI